MLTILPKAETTRNILIYPRSPWQLTSAFLKRWDLSTSKNTPRWATRSWPRFCLRNTGSCPNSSSWNTVKISRKRKQEFQEKMVLFREQHPELVQNSKKPDVPKGSQSKVPKKFQENVQKVKPPPENHLPMKGWLIDKNMVLVDIFTKNP